MAGRYRCCRPSATSFRKFVQEAPPMRGGEFLTSDLLERLWQEFGALVIRESAATGLSGWLKSKNPLWHTVGRVTFHLAENKRDPNRPIRVSSHLHASALRAGKTAASAAGARFAGVCRSEK